MMSQAVVVLLALLVCVSEVAAHNFDWVKTLDDCWQNCLDSNGSGCNSEKCICNASQGDDYLPNAVSCMRSECNADDWTLGIFLLGPLQMWCGLAGNSVPEDIMSSAYACATVTATSQAPLTTHAVQHSSSVTSMTQTYIGDSITGTSTSTITSTTTDSDGHTIALIVPIVLGPGTISYGKTETVTLSGQATSTTGSTFVSSAPSASAEISSPASTQAEQGQHASSTTSSKAAKKTSNNNGSPFDNMQAGAGQSSFSGPLLGLGAVAALFMGL